MNDFEMQGTNLISYKGSEEFVCIPEGVTTIHYDAFARNKTIRKVYFPTSVTEIRARAFTGCSSLEEVVFPDTITRIGERAFDSCYALKEVAFPEGLTHIDDYAFEMCNNLQMVHFPSTLQTIGYMAFCRCEKLEAAIVPDVTEIQLYAFDGCSKLKEQILFKRHQELKKESAIVEWLEENLDEQLGELVKLCAYESSDNRVLAKKAQSFLRENAGEDERFVAAYILIAAAHAQYHDADEGYFPLDEACRLFAEHDAEDACREMAENIELDEEIDELMQRIKFFIMGL